MLKGDIFEVLIGVGDSEVPRGNDRISWRVVLLTQRILRFSVRLNHHITWEGEWTQNNLV